MTGLNQTVSGRIAICILMLGCVCGAKGGPRSALEVPGPPADKDAPMAMAFGKDGDLFVFYKAKAATADHQSWHLLRIAKPLSKNSMRSDIEISSESNAALALLNASAGVLLSSDGSVLLSRISGYSAKGEAGGTVFAVDTQESHVLARLDVAGLHLTNPQLIGFSSKNTVLISSVPQFRFSKLTVVEFDARTLKELNRCTLSLETAAELCEPTSIENAWCKAAASKDSKGARVFEAGSTSPKNGQFVSLPDGYGGVHFIKSTPSGLLIVASDEDRKTAAPTNLRLFVKRDNGGVISTSPVLPPCDVTNVQTSQDELVGLLDCSETRRSVLDTYYTAKRNAVVFSIQNLQILAEIPDSKNRRASGAIWHDAEGAVVAIFQNTGKLAFYSIPARR